MYAQIVGRSFATEAHNKEQVLFVISQPDVYKSPSSNTYMYAQVLIILAESSYAKTFQ